MRVTPVAYKREQSVIRHKYFNISVIRQKMCFSIICVNFAAGMQNLIFSTIFRKKYSEIAFSRTVKFQAA